MSDDTADFLKREQQVLGGESAAFFQFEQHNSSSTSPPSTLQPQDDWGTFDNDGIITSSHNFQSTTSPNGQSSNFSPASTMSMTLQSGQHVGGEEPDVIKEWRVIFQKQIEERDERSKKKHAEITSTAKQSLERFYNDYNSSKQKGIAKNRDLEKKEGDKRIENDKGNVWEKAVKQIETVSSQSSTSNAVRLKPSTKLNNPGGITSEKEDSKEKKNKAFVKVKDTSRMKEVLKSLVKDGDNAPGTAA
jgi:hypothetical protein